MLSTQIFLKENGLDAIQKEFAIIPKRHKTYPNLVLFVYNQIESPKNHPVVRECRGLILDEANDWAIVNYTYFRFWNQGESCADNIDWQTAKVLEKEDGSLAQLYFYDNQWHIATKGTPDASGNVGDFNFTFKELFWKTWNSLGYSLPLDIDLCYAFELCTQYNRVVVRHPNNRLVLHGVRNLNTLQELDPEIIADKNGWECIKSYPLNNLNDVLKAVEDLNGIDNEGYVVVDANFKRLKIKSPGYVNIAHLKDGFENFSMRRMLELIKTGESEEFLVYFEEFRELHNEIKSKYDNFISEVNEFYDSIKNTVEQKDFAKLAITKKYSGLLFSMRKGDSLMQLLGDIQINKLESFLNIKIHEKA